MFDYLTFRDNEGSNVNNELLLFSLSTCSFCAEARRFLTEGGYRFRWVVTDELPFADRRKLRNEFIRTFREPLRYPALVVDSRKVLTGFEMEKWREELEGKDSSGHEQLR